MWKQRERKKIIMLDENKVVLCTPLMLQALNQTLRVNPREKRMSLASNPDLHIS